MAKLGCCIDEFEFNGFLSPAARMHPEGLEEKSRAASGISSQKTRTSALMEAGRNIPHKYLHENLPSWSNALLLRDA